MGSSNQKPDTAKITHSAKIQQMEYICMEMRGNFGFMYYVGWRKEMQDSAIYDL